MSAIITDQLRILNAKSFVSMATSSNTLYSFIGLPNATDYDSKWNITPPSPKDCFDEESDYWDTMIALKKIKVDDVKQVIRKITWSSGRTYDMYRHDINRYNPSYPSQSLSLYSANYYVVNQDYTVYICLQNGTTPENPQGSPSLDEPLFTDLEPKAAGNSGDGYIWKYLYTIKPSDIVKFDSINFMPIPKDWETNEENVAVRLNAAPPNGQLKIITITDRGVGVGTANRTYTRVPIKGDGIGAEATIVIDSDEKVDSIFVSNGGSGYTYGTVDLDNGNVPYVTRPSFKVIIPPQGGHGADIYRELGAYNVLIYSRIENDIQDPDFITGNQIARIGLVCNPQAYDSTSILSLEKASALNALKLTGTDYDTEVFTADTYITQTVSTGITAVGRVISYDQSTGVLKYWQDKTLVGFAFTSGISQNTSPTYGLDMIGFTTSIDVGGSLTINGGTKNLSIDINFGTPDNPGVTTSINNKTYYLGQSFTCGISNPEVKKYSGSIIYVDNRPSITRSSNQKEDIKVILQF
jgi:hypothetical protein